ALPIQLQEKQPHPARVIRGGAGPLPSHRRAGCVVTALDLGDLLRLQRHALEPAMHLADIRCRKADAGEPLAAGLDRLADAIARRTVAVRRHQFKRDVVEREQYAIGAVAAVAPGWRAAEQGLIRGGALADVLDEN